MVFKRLQETFFFFKTNFWNILKISLPLFLPLLALNHWPTDNPSTVEHPFSALAIVIIVLEILSKPIYAGLLAYLFACLVRQAPWNLRAGLQLTLQRFNILLLLSIYCGVMIMLGSILFILPGLWLFSRYAFVNYLAVYQNLSFTDALRTSVKLTKPYRLPIMACAAILYGVVFGIGFSHHHFVIKPKLVLSPFGSNALAILNSVIIFFLGIVVDIMLFRFFCLAVPIDSAQSIPNIENKKPLTT